MTAAGRFRAGLALAVAAAVTLRARFLVTPLTTDEGGFVAIARAWWGGRDLYGRRAGDVWVDRPQGGLLMYRAMDALLGRFDVTLAVRVLGVVAGAVAVVAVAGAVRALATERAAVLAAVLVAVLGAAPRLEGFVANGELLTGAVSATAVALGIRALRRPERRTAPLVAAGVVAGLSISIKQSGLDALVVLVVAAATGMVAARPDRAARRRDALAVAAGAAAVLGGLLVHGLVTGAGDWWFAMVGYRAASRSAWRGADLDRLRSTAQDALVVLGPLLVAALLVLATTTARALRGRRAGRAASVGQGRPLVPPVLLVWLGVSLASFWSGGQYFRHYWLILVWPLAAVGAVLLDHAERPGLVLAAVLVIPVADAARFAALDRADVPEATSQDPRLVTNEQVADWAAARSTGPVYALCASAALYALTGDDPPAPLLWYDGVTRIDGGIEEVVAALDGPDRPGAVALFQWPDRCDPSGRLAAVVARRYCPAGRVGGVEVLTEREVDRSAC